MAVFRKENPLWSDLEMPNYLKPNLKGNNERVNWPFILGYCGSVLGSKFLEDWKKFFPINTDW